MLTITLSFIAVQLAAMLACAAIIHLDNSEHDVMRTKTNTLRSHRTTHAPTAYEPNYRDASVYAEAFAAAIHGPRERCVNLVAFSGTYDHGLRQYVRCFGQPTSR